MIRSYFKRGFWRSVGAVFAHVFGMRRRDALLKSSCIVDRCIVCIDESGIIMTANPAASRLFGCAAYELLDEPIAKFISLFAGDGASARLARCMAKCASAMRAR